MVIIHGRSGVVARDGDSGPLVRLELGLPDPNPESRIQILPSALTWRCAWGQRRGTGPLVDLHETSECTWACFLGQTCIEPHQQCPACLPGVAVPLTETRGCPEESGANGDDDGDLGRATLLNRGLARIPPRSTTSCLTLHCCPEPRPRPLLFTYRST